MQVREIISVYSEDNKKRIRSLCEQIQEVSYNKITEP
jgi:hypothetical protein